jgi:hypothetical protein
MKKLFFALIILASCNKDTTNHALLDCVKQTDGTDGDCEWCDMLTEDKDRNFIKVERSINYSVIFTEKKGAKVDTFALDYLTPYEYKTFRKHSKTF